MGNIFLEKTENLYSDFPTFLVLLGYWHRISTIVLELRFGQILIDCLNIECRIAVYFLSLSQTGTVSVFWN